MKSPPEAVQKSSVVLYLQHTDKQKDRKNGQKDRKKGRQADRQNCTYMNTIASLYNQTDILTNAHEHTHTHTYTKAHTHTHYTHTYTHTHTNTRERAHTHTHLLKRSFLHQTNKENQKKNTQDLKFPCKMQFLQSK
jgi:hypothetical protein